MKAVSLISVSFERKNNSHKMLQKVENLTMDVCNVIITKEIDKETVNYHCDV